MTMQRLSVDRDCKNSTCPAVLVDNNDHEHVYVVGVPVPAETVRLPDGTDAVGPGEVVVRVPRQVIEDGYAALPVGVALI